MKTNSPNDSELQNAWSWIAVILISFGAYIYLSNAFTGQNLHIWGDEITYSADSRSLNFAQSTYPVYVYLSVFSITHFFASGFLESARHLNAVFIALSLPFLYLTAKAFIARPWAIGITLITAISPITTYAAYFMPDAMFFSVFFVYAWFFLTKNDTNAWRYGAGVGALLALLTLIKPHGMLLFGSTLFIYCIYFFNQRSYSTLIKLLKISAASLIVFSIIRLGASYFFASSVDLVGAYAMWSFNGSHQETLARYIPLLLTLLRGHVISLIAIIGPGLLMFFISSDPLQKNSQEILRLKIFVGCTFLLMLVVTLLFSTKIGFHAPPADAMRLHMRYYNYLFPLLYILLATVVNDAARLSKTTIFTSLLLALIALSISLGSLSPYGSLPLDAPELSGISHNRHFLNLIGAAVALTLIIFCFRPAAAIKAYLGAIVPCAALIATVYVNIDLLPRKTNLLGDAAGKMIREQLSGDKRISFFGEVVAINQAQFYAGGAGSYCYVLEPDAPVPSFGTLSPFIKPSAYNVGIKELPSTNWVMVVGNHQMLPNYSPYLSNPGWVLYKKNNGVNIATPFNLTDASWLNGISRTGNGLFVENAPGLRDKLHVGQTLQFSDKQLRTVEAMSEAGPYLNIFTTGPALDGNAVGYPHGVELFD